MRARGRKSLWDGVLLGERGLKPAGGNFAEWQCSGIDKIKHLINRVFSEK